MILNLLEKSVDYYFARTPRKRPPLSLLAKTHLIAHRGAHDRNQQIIENTDAAFSQALNLGCWGIEFDVQQTADQMLVVNHDPTLKRLWGKDIAINKLTFQELRQLVPQVPSLAEVVRDYGKRMHLFIELKTPFAEEALLREILKELTPCEDYHLLSLDETTFTSFSQFSKKTLLLVASHNNVKKFCRFSLEKNYGGVLGHYLLMNKRIIKQLQASENQAVGVGLIDSKFSLYRELNRGVHWLFSNNIALLSACLQGLKTEESQTPPKMINKSSGGVDEF